MKLLVTGGAGFIGSAVVRLAVARGHRVVNLDALTYAANLANVASVAGSPAYAFEHADIRDRAALDRVFSAHDPDAVMHLAAESHVDRSIDGPGANIRDWLYVEDHADALLLVLEKGALGRSDNIGGENERTNLDLVRTFCAILDRLRPKAAGSYADQIAFVADRPGHDARYAIDPSRIRRELGWRPSVTVEEGLERTVRWYLDNEAWWRPLLDRQGVGQRLGTKA
jgi:dTDP-D-glucose 4,6-dehydratase